MKHLFYLCAKVLMLMGLFYSSNAQMQYTETNAYLKANAYWAWYNHIGIDWSSGLPVYDSNRLNSIDTSHGLPGFFISGREMASTAASDPNTGELLFYMGGVGPGPSSGWRNKLVNKRHEFMPRGSDSLFGNKGAQAMQANCIVPMPGDSTKYYAFSVASGSGFILSPKYQLYYNVVDVTLDGGNGDVVSGYKNIPVDSSIIFVNNGRNDTTTISTYFGQGMVAIPGNDCDVWLLTHVSKGANDNIPNQNYYYAYHITESGVASDPVISPSTITEVNVLFHIAPNRELILAATAYPYFSRNYTGDFDTFFRQLPSSQLLNFDPETGRVNSSQGFAFIKPNADPEFIDDYFNIVSAAFSPDNSKLYTINSNYTGSQTYLTQFAIGNQDSIAILQSQTIIDSFGNSQIPPTGLFCMPRYIPSLKLYNDTIFMAWGMMNKISSINKPNEPAATCEMQLDYFSLPLGKMNAGGREFNEVVYPMYAENMLVQDTLACNDLVLTPRVIDPNANYKWNNGETSSTITINSGDKHWVTYSFLQNNCVYIYTDTFKVTWSAIYPTPQITINRDTLSTSIAYETYQWLYNGDILPGETNSKLTITSNGDYRVIVTNSEGCRDTSEVYTVDNRIGINAPSGLSTLKLFPNPTYDIISIQYRGEVAYQLLDITGRDLSGLREGKEVNLTPYAPGVYQLIIFDNDRRKLGAWKVSKL